jgi:hypothetical protein
MLEDSTGKPSMISELWFKKYEVMPPELQSALANVKDVPVDIDPISPFKEKVQ